MGGTYLLKAAEFAYWVGTVVGVALVVGLVGGLLVWRSLVGVKLALFLLGFALFGVGALGMQPTPPHEDEKKVDYDSVESTDLEDSLQEFPPLAEAYLPVDERVGRATKIFVAGLCVLALSLFMELGLGVTAT